MYDFKHTNELKTRTFVRGKPRNYLPRNQINRPRPPFPLLRRRVMSGRYPNTGFRPFVRPQFRPGIRMSRGMSPGLRYHPPPNTPFGVSSPSDERPVCPNAQPSNLSNNRNDQFSFSPRPPTVMNYNESQTSLESSEYRNSQMKDQNMFDLWVEALAPNGKIYYYNARTRETNWEKPINVRIIDLSEIKRLTGVPESLQSPNSPKQIQSSFIRPATNSPYVNSMYAAPRPFMPPRLLMFPPPSICNPQIFTSCTEPVQDTTPFHFNVNIPPPILPFSIVRGNPVPNNENFNSQNNYSFIDAHTNLMQTSSEHCVQSTEFSHDESKISDWSVSESNIFFCAPTSDSEVAQDISPKIEDSDAVQIDPKLNHSKSEDSSVNDTQSFTTVMQMDLNLNPSKSEVNNANDSKGFTNVEKMDLNFNHPNLEDSNVNNTESCSNVVQMDLNVSHSKSKDSSMNNKNVTNVVQMDLNRDHPKSEDSNVNNTEGLINSTETGVSSEESKENIKKQQVDRSRPVSSTPVPGTCWCVVWTGDPKVFYYDYQRKISVWDRPIELINRIDVDKLTAKPILFFDTKSKTTSRGPDGAKKMKTGDEKGDISDLSVNNEDTETVKDANEEENLKSSNIPHEQRIKIFREMLFDNQVSAFSTWEKELHKIVFDSRHTLLSPKERKQTFEAYISEKLVKDKADRQKEIQCQKDGFRSLLEEVGVTSKTCFNDFALRFGKDVRFKSIEKIKQKENLFNQFVSEITKNERSKMEKREKFIELLKEQQSLTRDSIWSDVEKKILNDERYKVIASEPLKEKIFNKYILGFIQNSSSSERERVSVSIRNREEQVKRDLSVALKDREREQELHKRTSAISDFKALLNDLIKNSDYNWHSAKKVLKEDHRWDYSNFLEAEEREELFNQHIDLIHLKKKEQFHYMLDGIPGIGLKTSWLDIRKFALDNPVCSKFSSSERKCEKEFKEYLRQKFLSAKTDFKQLLKETRIITYKSKSLLKDTNHLKDIEKILSNDKRYLVLENIRSERREMLLSYINKLHSQGPPPPPTATEPSMRMHKN